MKKLIIVSDWVDDRLTCQEVRTTVEGFLQDPSSPNITFVSSTPNTIHTSFLISQLVTIEERFGRPLETVIFQNTDPRLHTNESIQLAKGAEFVIVRLKSGIYVTGPNAGYNYTFIKPKIDAIFRYPALDKGSQFRSRDLYSRVNAHLMDSLQDEMELDEITLNAIPELTGYYIGHIDNYGNIKTTIPQDSLKGKYEYGDYVTVRINQLEKKIKYVDNLFGGTPGELVLYPGSSGDIDNLYMEISVWRHFTESDTTTGLHAFNYPKPGIPVEIIQ